MMIVISYFLLKKCIEMHKEGYKMNFINLVLDKVYSQSPNMKEDYSRPEDKGVLDEVNGAPVIAIDRIVNDLRDLYGADDTVADGVRNCLNYFKPKEKGWFIPKDLLSKKTYSDSITDGKITIWVIASGGYIIQGEDFKVYAEAGGYQAEINGKLFSGKAVAQNKKALDIFMGN